MLVAHLITVCDEASAERCPPALGAADEIHWSFRDPSTATGTDSEKAAFARDVRDDIRRRIDEWVAEVQDTLERERLPVRPPQTGLRDQNT